MNQYQKQLEEDRRLVILRTLSEIPSHTLNESVIETTLSAIGHDYVMRKNVREDLRFLNDCGCLTIEWYDNKFMKATLTRRGVYVSQGKELIEGIKKPSLVN